MVFLKRHIIEFLGYQTIEMVPYLYLESAELGNIHEVHERFPLSVEEQVVLLHQSSLGLAYLHDLPEAIAHRDIKPENILVLYRDPSEPRNLHIKLSEFGYIKPRFNSKGMIPANTIYCPPELCQPNMKAAQREEERRPTGGVKEDIWSLGVVILGIAFTLPDPGDTLRRSKEWCKNIADYVWSLPIPEDRSTEGLLYILQRMLVMYAEMRSSADKCCSDASRLLALMEQHEGTPASSREASLVPGPSQPYLVSMLSIRSSPQ